MRAVVMAEVSRAERAEVHRAEARWTWVMEARDCLEARRWGRSLSREMGAGDEAVGEAGAAWGAAGSS